MRNLKQGLVGLLIALEWKFQICPGTSGMGISGKMGSNVEGLMQNVLACQKKKNQNQDLETSWLFQSWPIISSWKDAFNKKKVDFEMVPKTLKIRGN